VRKRHGIVRRRDFRKLLRRLTNRKEDFAPTHWEMLVSRRPIYRGKKRADQRQSEQAKQQQPNTQNKFLLDHDAFSTRKRFDGHLYRLGNSRMIRMAIHHEIKLSLQGMKD
jgi:hypothetical protein